MLKNACTGRMKKEKKEKMKAEERKEEKSERNKIPVCNFIDSVSNLNVFPYTTSERR